MDEAAQRLADDLRFHMAEERRPGRRDEGEDAVGRERVDDVVAVLDQEPVLGLAFAQGLLRPFLGRDVAHDTHGMPGSSQADRGQR